MSIIPNSFRKQKKYITDENGDHELVSTWTSTDTVETTDGETLTDYLDSHVNVTIDVTTPSEVAKRYTFTQNDTVIGVVDIPLDMVVSAATVETVVTPDVPYEGAEIGDKYIDMVIANSSEDHIYIPCKDIISDDSVNKVKQSNSTTNTDYRVLLSHSANDTTETAGVNKSAGLRYNPNKNALAIGSTNSATGNNSIAEGSFTTASGTYSHSEGYASTASGYCSHAEGVATASENYSHAEGSGVASGVMSHTEGYQTIANHSSQHVFGECNIPDDSSASSIERGNYVEIVGNGTTTSNRSNARTLDWDGNEVLAGKITVGAAPTNDMDVATKKYVDDNAGTSTDEKVKQMDSSTSSSFRLLLSNSADDTTETAEVKKNATLTYNPGTQSLKIAKNNNANKHTTIQSGGTITTNDPSHLAGSQDYLVDEYGNRKTSLDHNINYYRSNNSQQFNGQIEANASYSEDDASGIMINVGMELTPNTFDPKLSFEKQVTDLGEGTTTTKTVEYGVEDIALSETWDGTHTSLKDAIANAGGGTTVVANPTGTPTDELTSIQIGEDIYEIVGSGGGGGNAGLQKTVLLNTPITTTGTYTLADYYTNYDFIAIQAGNGSNEVDIHIYTSDEITTAMTNNLTITNPNTGGWFNFTMNANEITIPGMQISTINSVVGYKIIGGGGGSDAQIDTLFSANDYQENITLAHPYTDYDVLIINGVAPINNDSYQCSTTYITHEININNNIGAYTDGSVIWYNVNDTTHLSCIGRQDVYVTAIYGIKYGSGGGGGSTNVIEKTQAQYDALTQAEKENGSIYMVKSTNTILTELTEPQTHTSTKVTASSYMMDTNLQQYHYPFGAFNRVSPTTWEYPNPGVTTETTWTPNISVDGSNSWIQYEFDTPVRMTSMKIWAFADYSSDTTKSFIIEGSNDGTTFTNILADGESSCDITATLHQNYENIIDLDDTDSYTYVRLRSLEPMGASYQPTIFIDEIFVYGYGTTSVNRIYYMDTEYANTEVGSSGSDADIVTYNATVTTSEYGWWIVEDENGNALDPSQYIIVDIVPKYDGYTETAVGCRWTINSNVDGSNTARYAVTLENINDGGFIRSSRTVELQVSYKLK